MHFVEIAAVALTNGYDQCAMKDFIPGLELASKFYEETVRPILESVFSGVPYSAALIGTGSEVLGFDTEMTADHHSRAESDVVFGGERDYERQAGAITESLRQKLPLKFRGYSGQLLEA